MELATTKEIFEKIHNSLNKQPERIGGLAAVYEFDVTGDDDGVYQIILSPASAQVVEGRQEPPNCKLQIACGDFKDMVEGRLAGTNAFMSGKLKIDGDMSLAMRLESVLGAYSA